MPRQIPVLRWALPRQSGSRGVGAAHDVNQSRQRILSNTTKELPFWALAFSSRRVLTSAVTYRPRQDSNLHSMALDWEREGSASQSYEQVLSEWKASQERLQDKISQVNLPYIAWGRPPEAPQHPPLPEFFASHRPSTITQTRQEGAAEMVASDTRAVLSDMAPNRIHFISDLDERILERAVLPSMLQIRDGERDMAKLANVFLSRLEASAIEAIDNEMLQEQARLFVFSHWISRASNALASKRLRISAIALCLNVTAELYRSMLKIDGQVIKPKTKGLNGMRKAALHRLFGLFYPYTGPQFAAHSTANLSCRSLTFLSKLLRDENFRPNQLRFLYRRYLNRLEQMATVRTQACHQEYLWHEAVELVKILSSKGFFNSAAIDKDGSSTSSSVDTFLRLLCLALHKGNVKYAWAKAAILDLARASQVMQMQQKTLSRVMGSNNGALADTSQECSLGVAPFVRQSTLEDMTKLLCQSGHFELAKEIAFMAPREQRSIRVLSQLMLKWSSVLPNLPGEVDTRRRQSRRQIGSFRTCTFSQQLWTEAMSLLDFSRSADHPVFVDIFNARLASHARSKSPRLVDADLKALRLVYGKKATLSDLLGLLSEQAQVEIIRAHSRSGNLTQARQWAHKVVIAANARQEGASNTASGHLLPLQVMNVLFSAYIKLKGNKKVLTARRRFSVLVRQAGGIKQQRVHLHRTINQFLRGKRKEVPLSKSTRSRQYLVQLHQAFDYLCAFATRHGIVPDEKTARILLVAVMKLHPRIVTKETLERIKLQADFDWKSKGVVKVLDEVKTLLKGGKVESLVHPLSTKEGRARADMITVTIEKRQYWQDFGLQKGAKR